MAVETYLSGWPLSSWISPGAAFFLFVNVLIGAIVVTSRGHHRGCRAAAAASTRRLCRSASSMVLDRLRSFSMFAVHPVPMEMEEYYTTSLEPEAEEQQPQPAVAEPARSPVAAAVAAPDADDEAAAHGLALQQGHGQQPPSGDVVTAGDNEAAAAVEREEEKAAELQEEEATMLRAPACRRETEEEALEGKAALNARAESFIRKFREDLKLERLNSIINYTRSLRRGAGAASPTAQ